MCRGGAGDLGPLTLTLTHTLTHTHTTHPTHTPAPHSPVWQAARLGLVSSEHCARRLTRSLSPQCHLRWGRIFGSSTAPSQPPQPAQPAQPAPSDLPLKLEIASGTGDWVVAQAHACTHAHAHVDIYMDIWP